MSDFNPDHVQHLCACHIDLANEGFTTISRDTVNPVPWTEVRVLQEVHGEDAVYDIRPVSLGPRTTPKQEKERLVLIYGRDLVENVYAGKSFYMEWFVPGWPIDPEKAPKKPLQKVRPPKIRDPDAEASDSRI
jgi:hypothetical protein